MSRTGTAHSSLAVFLECRLRKEGEKGPYVAYCDKLHLTDQGKTPKEAQRNLRISMEVYFEACASRGDLERVLDQKGVSYTRFDGPNVWHGLFSQREGMGESEDNDSLADNRLLFITAAGVQGGHHAGPGSN